MSGMAEARSLLEVSVEERMKSMLGKSGISITITSITNLLAFGVGATSVFISIRNFCIYTGQCCRHVGYRKFKHQSLSLYVHIDFFQS